MLHEFLLTLAVFVFLYTSATTLLAITVAFARKANWDATYNIVAWSLSGALLVLEIVQWI